MRDYTDIVSQIRIAAIGVKKPSKRLTLMQDAADAIEELLKINAELENSGRVLMAAFARLKEKVPQWISVEERLPTADDGDPFDRCLVFTDEGQLMTLPLCKVGMGYATHWMIVKPPKEARDEM